MGVASCYSVRQGLRPLLGLLEVALKYKWGGPNIEYRIQ